jgi:hypothetical protein
MRKRHTTHQPQPVNFELNDIDLEVALLGEAGWHAHAIAEETNLSKGQVHYRLGLAGVKLKNYRNGKSEMSRFMVTMIQSRNSAKERITEVREIPEKFGNLQQQYMEVCSTKRKPKKGSD